VPIILGDQEPGVKIIGGPLILLNPVRRRPLCPKTEPKVLDSSLRDSANGYVSGMWDLEDFTE